MGKLFEEWSLSTEQTRGATRSALGELEALSGSRATWLLALTHAGITGQKAARLESGAIRFVELIQGTCDGKAKSTCLTLEPAAGGFGLDVIVLRYVEGLKGLENRVLHRRGGEVFVEVLAVNADFTGPWDDLDTGDSRLAASGGGGFGCGHDD